MMPCYYSETIIHGLQRSREMKQAPRNNPPLWWCPQALANHGILFFSSPFPNPNLMKFHTEREKRMVTSTNREEISSVF